MPVQKNIQELREFNPEYAEELEIIQENIKALKSYAEFDQLSLETQEYLVFLAMMRINPIDKFYYICTLN